MVISAIMETRRSAWRLSKVTCIKAMIEGSEERQV